MGELVPKFRWRARNGRKYLPSEMDTHHLYYTLRMIWNHSAPEHLKIRPYKKYIFQQYYSEDYIKEAVRVLLYELVSRCKSEFEPHMLGELNIMRRNIGRIARIESATRNGMGASKG